jgi:predicted amidophosphoribosyltransferase
VFTETERPAFERAEESGEEVSALWRFFLPSRCLACGRRPVESAGHGGVCLACWRSVAPLPPLRCRLCDEALEDETASFCGRCRIAPPAFASLRAAVPYRGAARDILLAFKFRGADYLARHLAQRMRRRLPPPKGALEVTAVPSVRETFRKSERAAELLAAEVANLLGLAFVPRRLAKRRATERQSGLPLARREENVRGAFRARGRCPSTVLLVDDVATSGATARECAVRLREAGADRVLVWCFARASRGDVRFEEAEPRTAGGGHATERVLSDTARGRLPRLLSS